MQAPKNITVIPATINPVTRLPKESKQLRRVAAYARVSTDSEEQLTSYEAQVDYYTRYIQDRPDWVFVLLPGLRLCCPWSLRPGHVDVQGLRRAVC